MGGEELRQLSRAKVAKIKGLCKMNIHHKRIADIAKVSYWQVRSIARGETWAHVEPNESARWWVENWLESEQ